MAVALPLSLRRSDMIPIHANFLLLAAGQGGSLVPFLVQVALIFAIFYFLLIRPQAKQRKQHEEALRNIKRGDTIVTTGGIVGEVVHVKETVKEGTPAKAMDDHITIKSGESRLIVERGRIARIGVSPSAQPSATP
jgi:preprotein translocase subunit YajC